MPAKLSSPDPAKRTNWFTNQMTAVKKFMFETVFEDTAPPDPDVPPVAEETEEEEAEPEEIVPTFSEEDLEAARKEGFQSGKEEGLNASLDSIERQVSATLGNMETEVTRLIDEQVKSNQELTHLALSVAVSIARKMLPEMASRNALAEIERVLEEVLPRLIDEPRITIRIHGDVESEVKSRLETLISNTGFTGQVVVSADNGLEIGDCRLEWSCGGAERNTAALWQEIDSIVARNFDQELVSQAQEVDQEIQDQGPATPTENQQTDIEQSADPSIEPDQPPTTDD